MSESYIRAYWQDICEGRATVGYFVRRQVELLIADLDNPDLKIDFAESEKRIRFIERECRHSEAPFAGKPFILMTWQKAVIEAIFAIKAYNDEAKKFVRKYQEVLLVVARKNGKALDVETKIPTPNGWRKMADLQVGDEVFAVDGTPSKIITTSPVRSNHDCYRVTFEDGAEIIADAGHLWTVTTKKRRIPFTITTEGMKKDFLHKRADDKGVEYKYRVPMNLPVEYPHKPLPISSYVLGVWLGDGESSGGRISCGEDDLSEMLSLVKEEGYSVTSIKRDKTCFRFNISRLAPKLRELNLINNKHIPQIYLQASIAQRWELLKGLMDTDGYCSKQGECEFVQKNKVVVDSMIELLSSLGIKSTVKAKIPTINGKKCSTVYRVFFFTDQMSPCFKLKRKIARLKSVLNKRMKSKSIVNIEAVESVPVKCIGIDHPTQLYLAGEQFTATHNTPFASAISLSEFTCGEMGTKILFGSNDYDQADLLFMAADAMREASPKLARCTRRNQKGLFFGNIRQKNRVGKFTSQNKGSIRKISARTSAKEGRNIKVGVVDEVHELKDDALIMPIKQALSTQEESLYIELTTEGFTDDGYLDERLKLAAAVLDGEVDKPNFLIFWYAQDSEEEIWRDEKSWLKSNPALGVVKKWSFLRGMVEDAKLSASTRAFVLAKDFNIKQNSSSAWLTEDVITNKATFDVETLSGQFYIGGFDFSETTDLTAAVALFVNPWTHDKNALNMYFVPETKAEALLEDNPLNPERKNYMEWARQGLVTICPGSEVDPDAVIAWFVDLSKNYSLRPLRIGFDNWHAKSIKDGLSGVFGAEILEKIGMDFMSLNGAMSSLESDLTLKKLNYGDNPITRWTLRNVALKLNNIGLKMPVKKFGSPKNRIDGAVALMIAYATLSRFRSDYMYLQKSIVQEGGLTVAI